MFCPPAAHPAEPVRGPPERDHHDVPTRRIVLASASVARERLLRQAGFDPEVMAPEVDESAFGADGVSALVLLLAEAKASSVAGRLAGSAAGLVVGCDSLLEIDGEVHGKPRTGDEAAERLRRLRGRSGVLRTGHCVIDTATGARASDVASTTVQFGDYDEAELRAYVATGEPLGVAGAFTLDGYSAPFVSGVIGDPSNVIGLSLPLLRALLRKLGVEVYDLWR